MRLLLANMELYREWISKAAARVNAYTEEAFAEARRVDQTEFTMVNSTAIISVTGPLSYKYDIYTWYYGGTSYMGLMNQIRGAEANPDVKSIMLLMDTPGGEVTGVSETAKVIAACSKEVTAMVDPCCASAGLWLASQASKIISVESGEVGSLGVQCVAVSYAKMFEEAGIDVRLVRADISPDKNLAHPYEPLSDKAMEYLQDRVDRAGARFVSAVAAGRKVSEDVVLKKFGQGRMLEADEALEAGLIDEVSTVAAALSKSSSGSSQTTRRRGAYRRNLRIV